MTKTQADYIAAANTLQGLTSGPGSDAQATSPATPRTPLNASLKYSVHTSLHEILVALQVEVIRTEDLADMPVAATRALTHAISMTQEAMYRVQSATSAVEAYEQVIGPIKRTR